MTPEAQRMAIAEACGWKPTTIGDGVTVDDGFPPPDYLSDLNAMHEAEKVLTPKQERYNWRGWLELICGTMGGMLHATAAQRAEAFLRTIGKWIDDEPGSGIRA